jgi:hypothetical protein
VNLAIHARNVIDAIPLSVRKGLEVAKNVLACAYGNLQVPVSLKMIVAIQKSVPDQ